MDVTPLSDRITVLMAVYNGAACLDEQINSIRAQTHPHWHLIISDDGSTDGSDAVLRAQQSAARAEGFSIDIQQGPRQGAAANFMSLLRRLGDTAQDMQSANAEWIAFCDQDDVWLPDKLARAHGALATQDRDTPALYCSRTWVCTADLSKRRLSAPRPRAPGFSNALVQNIAAGNTILLNPAASALVLRAAGQVDAVVVHDWWAYQLVTGAGGVVVHDDTPGLLYRQHAVNQIGANDTTWARVRRIGQLLRGDFRDWNRINITALRATQDALTDENRRLLDDFARLPDLALIRRLALLRRMRLYRQTTISTAALWLAAVLARL